MEADRGRGGSVNESQTEFQATGAAPTQDALVLEMLTANKGQWVAMPKLVEHCGGYAVHSRAAGLRKAGHNVENMVDRSSKPFKSFYRLVP